MTSKERALLKARASTLDAIFSLGKSSLTPEFSEAVREALEAREIVKINVLNNCTDEPKELARILSERTGSEVVQVIGKKIVLFKKRKLNENNPKSKTDSKSRSKKRNG